MREAEQRGRSLDKITASLSRCIASDDIKWRQNTFRPANAQRWSDSAQKKPLKIHPARGLRIPVSARLHSPAQSYRCQILASEIRFGPSQIEFSPYRLIVFPKPYRCTSVVRYVDLRIHPLAKPFIMSQDSSNHQSKIPRVAVRERPPRCTGTSMPMNDDNRIFCHFPSLSYNIQN